MDINFLCNLRPHLVKCVVFNVREYNAALGTKYEMPQNKHVLKHIQQQVQTNALYSIAPFSDVPLLLCLPLILLLFLLLLFLLLPFSCPYPSATVAADAWYWAIDSPPPAPLLLLCRCLPLLHIIPLIFLSIRTETML